MRRVLAMWMALVVGLAATVSGGCGGPCKQVRREWAAVHETRAPAAAPHIIVQVPYAVANRLITQTVGTTIEVPLRLDALGLIAPYIASLRARVTEVALEPGPPGKVRFVMRIELADDAGLLIALRAHADVAPDIEPGPPPAITFALRADQLARLEPELGAKAAAALGDALVARVPADMASRVPRFLVDRAAAKVLEELVERGHLLLRDTLLTRLGELTRLRFQLPAIPIAGVEVSSPLEPAPMLELALRTSLPVRAGVASAVPVADAITVHVAGSAAAELANWGVAEGHLPRQYTRKLKPDPGGAYTPYLDWRADHADRPLLVHMFALHEGCAHFAAGALPHVRVEGGKVFAHVSNRRLEHSVGPPLLELLAEVNGFFQRSVSRTKSAAATTKITLGGRTVDAALISAEITPADIHAAFTVSVSPPPAAAP